VRQAVKHHLVKIEAKDAAELPAVCA